MGLISPIAITGAAPSRTARSARAGSCSLRTLPALKPGGGAFETNRSRWSLLAALAGVRAGGGSVENNPQQVVVVGGWWYRCESPFLVGGGGGSRSSTRGGGSPPKEPRLEEKPRSPPRRTSRGRPSWRRRQD